MTSAREPKAFWFGILCLPFGASSGFLTVTIGYLAARAEISKTDFATLAAIGLLPHTWKFLWAPVVDATLSRHRWYTLANVVTAGSLCVIGLVPISESTLSILGYLFFAQNVATTFVGMATEGLLAETTTERTRGRAAGWFQAGNLGGAGLGGGAALFVAEHVSGFWAASSLGLACLACTIALFYVPEPASHASKKLLVGITGAVQDLWSVVRSRAGLLCLALCILPICHGAAANLWSACADDFGASADMVAVVNGTVQGIAAAVGCLLGGLLSDRMNRKLAYAVAAMLLIVAAVGMAAAPRVPSMYATFVLLYSIATGVAYGTFTGFVLEVIGRGAVATKYNIFASVSNMPLAYMGMVDGWAYDRWGLGQMLLVEAGAGVLGLVVLASLVAWLAQRPARAAAPAVA
jgi:MFS family permease